jgi:hypothetical protein
MDRFNVGTALGIASLLPVGAGGRAATSAASGLIKGATKKGSKRSGFVPGEMARRYPETLPPVLAKDKKTGKEFLQKTNSAEADSVAAARKAAQKDIEAGNYKPYFDVAKRFDADASKYGLLGNTLTDTLPKKAETLLSHQAKFDTPEIRQRLGAGYEAAAKDPLAKDWYMMGQLEKKFIEEYGPKEGRRLFKESFADAMAATTGGSDPTSNLLMAHYGNYLRQQGKRMPDAAYEFPYPVGGRFASGNAATFNKVINDGAGLNASDMPKRFNFSGNFLGHKDRMTIDEQMMGGVNVPDAKGVPLKAPPQGTYGVIESTMADLARQYKVDPRQFQEVAWAGLKGTKGKPMIQHVNEAIERTSRITGMTPDEVVKQSLVRRTSPLYGVLPFGLLGFQGDDQFY